MADFRNTRISERKFYRIEPVSITADGGVDGQIFVTSTYGYKVNQKVTLRSDSLQPRTYKIKRIVSETEIRVGDFDRPQSEYADVSDMLVADNAVLVLPEQKRPSIDPLDIQGMVFEEEPTVALRTHNVDYLGRSFGENNPMPVQLSDGSIDIGTVNAELEVQLSSKDDDPDAGDVADSVRVGDQNDYARITTSKGETTAGLNTVNLAKPFTKPWNSVEVTQKNQLGDPTEIITSFNGVQVQRATIVYDQRFDFESLTIQDL